MRCETCLNRYAVISENGLHYNCSLSEKCAMECILRKKEHYIPLPSATNVNSEENNNDKS